MTMTKWLWDPCEDSVAQALINEYLGGRENYRRLVNPEGWSDLDWQSVKPGDDLIILAHHSVKYPNRITGTDLYTLKQTYLTCNELARMIAIRLDDYHKSFRIKLWMCQGADRVRGQGGENFCFAGQLLAALKQEGYSNVKIAAYHGELYASLRHGHKVVATGGKQPGTFVLDDKVKNFAGILFVPRAGYAAARYHREWFTNKAFGTRWI
jgi:hypothetical protein